MTISKLRINKYTRTYLRDKLIFITVSVYSLKIVFFKMDKEKPPPKPIKRKNTEKKDSGLDPPITYELPARVALWEFLYRRTLFWPCIWYHIKLIQIMQYKDHRKWKRNLVWYMMWLGRMKGQDKKHQRKKGTFSVGWGVWGGGKNQGREQKHLYYNVF